MKFSNLRNSRKWKFAITNDFRLIGCVVCSFDLLIKYTSLAFTNSRSH